jgi:ketosteroid isomerase-like protein
VSANLDLVRSIHAAWERGDFSSAEWAHPDVQYENVGGPSPGRWTGRAGMAEGMRDFLSAWKDFRVNVDQYRELDDERVLALTSYSACGKKSGLELGQMWTKAALLFQLRAGKVTRIVSYWERENALADLGLASEAGSRPS